MAYKETVENLRYVVHEINDLDENRIMRPQYGDLSLQERRPNYFDKLKSKCAYCLKYASGTPNEYVERVTAIISIIYRNLVEINNSNKNKYPDILDKVLELLDIEEEKLDKYRIYFMVPHFIESGILEDDTINQRNALIKSVVGDLDDRIETAKDIIKESDHKRAVLTREATKGSFAKAIKQFEEAQEYLDRKCNGWLWASIGSILVFLVILLFFYNEAPEAGSSRGIEIYHTAIRIAMLAVLGGVSTFCLRVYRSQLHMSRHNYHKMCIAKIMDSFVYAAVDPEQRDKILSLLVESVVHFGSSGLVRDGDDHMTSPKLVIDQITKTLVPDKPKP